MSKKNQYLCTMDDDYIYIKAITSLIGIAKTILILTASYVLWTYRKK